jgi:RHS repeat-associated protein
VGPGVTVDYAYDPDGRRRSKSVNGTLTYYINDGANELAELSSGGSRLRFYVSGLQMDSHVAMYEDAGGTGWIFYHTNHQGSVVMTTSLSNGGTVAASYNYGAFGESTDAATGNAFRYTGRYLDAETGLYYYRARYYSAALGRFLQSDPIGVKDDLNLYAYVGNDPLDRTDPSGNCPDACVTEAGAGILGTVAYFGSAALVSAGICVETCGAIKSWLGGVWDHIVHNDTKADGPRESTLKPGPHAGDSIPARGPGRDFTRDERDRINDIGRETGCHTCGTTDPGTKSGDFVPDHQPPECDQH